MGKNSLIKSTAKKKKKPSKPSAPATPKATEKPIPKTGTPPVPKTGAAEKTVKPASPPVKKAVPKPPETNKTASEKSAPTPPKTEAPAPPVTITYDTPQASAPRDPMDKTLLIAAAAILFLTLLVIGASVTNTDRYYIKTRPMGIEIWRGKFAPLGEKKVMALPDMTAPEKGKTVYSRNDVYPLIFTHYLKKADALLARPGMPDYESIRAYLIRAQNYAVTNELADAASRRLVAIDFNNLLYRAAIAGNQNTVEDQEKALDYLARASRLKLDDNQIDQVTRQREICKEKLTRLQKTRAAENQATGD